MTPICDHEVPAWGPNGELVITLASGREKTGGFAGQIQRSEIVVLPVLPLASNGKVLKRLLKDMAQRRDFAQRRSTEGVA